MAMGAPLTKKSDTQGRERLNTTSQRAEKLGVNFVLLLIYLFMEYGRPPNPMKIPMMISIISFLGWVLLPTKKWNTQIVCLMLFLGVMGLGGLIARNSYSAFWITYGMVNILVFICIPLTHFVNSFRKVTLFINTLLAVFLYVGIFAAFSGGVGPAGSWGGQDENYTAAMMTIGMPLAYYSVFLAQKTSRKILFGGMFAIFVAAVVVGFSRGGFVSMVAVFTYLFIMSPKKLRGGFIGVLVVAALLLFASPKYWEEMRTITDTKESTADLRLEIWGIAFRMFLGNPLLGVGPGNFVWNAEDYQSEEQWEKFGRSFAGSIVTHSLYFELLAELGLAGAILFALILYTNYKDLRFVIKQQKELEIDLQNGKVSMSPEERETLLKDLTRAQYYAYALVGSLIGYLSSATFLSMLYFSHFWILTALIVALKEVTSERVKKALIS